MNKNTKLSKKIISLFLTLAMFCSVSTLSVSTAQASGGIEAKVATIKDKYPSNSFFSKNGKACTHGPKDNGCANCQLSKISNAAYSACGDGYSCWAFANYAFYTIYGIAPSNSGNSTTTVTSDKLNSAAQYGDYVICYNSSGKQVHYFIYLGANGSNHYRYESNYSKPNMVKYKRSCKAKGDSNEIVKYKVIHAKNYSSIANETSTFKFNSNGGSGTMSNKAVSFGTTISLPANSFTKPGYSFSHWNSYRASDGKWYTNENGWQTASAISSNGYTKKSYGNKWSGNFNNSWLNGKAKDTFTFYAVWSPNKLTITYNANGGSINSDKYYLNSGSNVYKYETYAALTDTRKYNETNKNGLYDAATFGIYRTGYTFKGWRSYDNGIRVFRDDDSTVTPYDINSSILNGNCNTTLYAVWEKNECSHLYLFDITKQPTCEENGIKTFTCIYCGDSYTVSVSALGHVEIVDSAIEPTCTTDGKTEGSHCSTCGKTLTEQKTIKAFGHDEAVIKGEPATFKAAGKTDGKKCKTCGKVTVAQKTIAKLGAPSLSTVSANSKGFKATWKSVSKIDGYQIQYSTSSSFKSGNKTVTVSGYKSTSKTVKSLKAKKKYYVRIRAYKTIDGKKQYSAWSKSKTVTTKK